MTGDDVALWSRRLLNAFASMTAGDGHPIPGTQLAAFWDAGKDGRRTEAVDILFQIAEGIGVPTELVDPVIGNLFDGINFVHRTLTDIDEHDDLEGFSP